MYPPRARAMMLLGIALSAGCGRLGFDERGPDAGFLDAPPDAERAPDYGGPLYGKARAPHSLARYGGGAKLSDDGRTLVVRAANEKGASPGIDGDDTNLALADAGAVFVYTRGALGDPWTQQAYIKSSAPADGELFGFGLALSPSGDQLFVGAPGVTVRAGRVYAFQRTGATWTQVREFSSEIAAAGDSFGISIDLSANGQRLAVGVPGRDGERGAVEIYDAQTFALLRTVTRASAPGDRFGATVALTTDASTLLVGAPREDSSAGAVYRFDEESFAERQRLAPLMAGSTFGDALALSRDGTTLVIGAADDSSPGVDANGDPLPGIASAVGAAHVFVRVGAEYERQAYLKSARPRAIAHLGSAVAISRQGDLVLVGAYTESSGATGVGGDQGDASTAGAGAAFLFQRTGGAWSQARYFKASNPDADDFFGSIAMTGDASVIVIGAPHEDSASTTDQLDNTAIDPGAIYTYDRSF